MGRLIDAEKTLDKECESCLCERGCVNCDFCELNKVLSAAPTVDAVPVVHGKWLDGECDNGGELWYCSRCNYFVKMIVGRPSFDYCPHCGAKMTEKGK